MILEKPMEWYLGVKEYTQETTFLSLDSEHR